MASSSSRDRDGLFAACTKAVAWCALPYLLSSCMSAQPLPAGPAARMAGPVGAVSLPGVYRGMLGTRAIELTLTQDQDAEDSVHGWYFDTSDGTHARVLLAGEIEGDSVSLEESRNGVDVSGNWSMTLSEQGLSGEWRDLDNTRIDLVHLARMDLTSHSPRP